MHRSNVDSPGARSDSRWSVLHIAAALAFAGILVLAAYGAATLVTVGCSETNEGDPGSEMCDAITGSEWSASLVIPWPAALFGATLLFPQARRHPVAVGLAVAILEALFWAWVLATVAGD